MNGPGNNTSFSRVFDLLPLVSRKFGDCTAFGCRKDGEWQRLSYAEYEAKANKVSHALLAKGIKKGDRIITISPNRPEFNVVDMGILQVGAIHVPVYQGLTDEKLFAILSETSCRIIFLSGIALFQKIRSVREQLPHLLEIISFEQLEGAVYYEDFLDTTSLDPDPGQLEEIRSSIQSEDPACIIYISGATTPVKGVLLTHGNQVSNILSYAMDPHLQESISTVSLLPLAHSYERIINYCEQYFGMTVWYNDKLPGMMRDFRETKPGMLVMVPLLIERLFSVLVQDAIKKGTFQASIIRKVISLAEKTAPGAKCSLTDRLFLLAGNYLIFNKWRRALGGKLNFILCGGASLPKKLLNLSHQVGIPIYEGYGITEAGPLVSYNNREKFKSYTVGKAMPGVEIRIADDGEVMVRSEGVMPFYFNNPGESARVLEMDGWLRTGDLGEIDREGFLRLTGIKKEIFKLSSGLYVSPAAIEAKLKESPWIGDVWVYGHNRNHLVALIFPDRERLFAEDPTSKALSSTDLLSNTLVITQIQDAIRSYNSMSRGPDQVIRYRLVSEEWNPGSPFKDRNGLLNRVFLTEKYRDLIERLYSQEHS